MDHLGNVDQSDNVEACRRPRSGAFDRMWHRTAVPAFGRTAIRRRTHVYLARFRGFRPYRARSTGFEASISWSGQEHSDDGGGFHEIRTNSTVGRHRRRGVGARVPRLLGPLRRSPAAFLADPTISVVPQMHNDAGALRQCRFARPTGGRRFESVRAYND